MSMTELEEFLWENDIYCDTCVHYTKNTSKGNLNNNLCTLLCNKQEHGFMKPRPGGCCDKWDGYEKVITCGNEINHLIDGNEWKPIISAPKDGTHILVCDINVSWIPPTSVHWYVGEDMTKENGWHLSVNQIGNFSAYRYAPTHWKTLPAAPQDKE